MPDEPTRYGGAEVDARMRVVPASAVLAAYGGIRGGHQSSEIAIKTLRAAQAFLDGQHLAALAKADSAVEFFARAHQ